MFQKFKTFHLLYFIPVILVFFFQYNLIVKDPILYRDDVVLVSGVASVQSLPDYWSKLQEGIFYDIQPARDLTFYVNIKLFKSFGWGGFHLFNTFLAIAILFLFRRFLKNLGVQERILFFVIMIFSVHPLFNAITAWTSNRKHLLSIFFILLYAIENQKEKPSGFKIFSWTTLSFLSQPITIFIPPLFYAFKFYFEKYRLKIWDYFTLASCTFFLGINYYFYNTNVRFLGRNAMDTTSKDLGVLILKFCRVPVQILFPTHLATEYNPGSYLSLLGIVLVVVLIFLHLKLDYSPRKTILYLIALTTLFPVLKWGPRDAYLFVTLMLALYILSNIFRKFTWKQISLPVIGLCCILSYYSYFFTNMYIHDINLHKTSLDIEGGMENHQRYAAVLSLYYPELAYDIIKETMEKFPDVVSPRLMSRLANAIYNHPKMSKEQKLEHFRKTAVPDMFAVFYEAILLKELNHKKEYDAAIKALKEALKNPYQELYFKDSLCSEFPDECKELGLKF